MTIPALHLQERSFTRETGDSVYDETRDVKVSFPVKSYDPGASGK